MTEFLAALSVRAADKASALEAVATIERRFAKVGGKVMVTISPLVQLGNHELVDVRCQGWIDKQNRRCSRPARPDSDYCRAHDPEFADERRQHLEAIRPPKASV